MDRSDAVIVRRVPASGPPERDRYEPRSDGYWMRVEEVWNGRVWRPRGRELIDGVGFENVPPQCANGLEIEQ